MTTIVLNTLHAAVTEYDWDFDAITPSYAVGPALYTLGGDLDLDQEIDSDARTGLTLLDQTHKKGVTDVYFALTSSQAVGKCLVIGKEAGVLSYEFAVRASGVSRAVPGKGIRENYLGFGYQNYAGGDFRLDRIEPSILQSQTRRIG